MIMVRVLLDHHSRLGDQFIMHGAIREYCKRYDQIGIFSIPKYYRTVSYMFRDLKNLHIEIAVSERRRQWFKLKNMLTQEYERVIYARGEDLETGVLPELQFYKMVDVNHEKKWSSFFVERERERELALYRELVDSEPYIFVHEDARYPLNEAKITNMSPRVSPREYITDNIFDYCTIIERAEEIHALDSSFVFLIDLLEYDNPRQKLFVHRYARPNPAFNLPILRKDWIILN